LGLRNASKCTSENVKYCILPGKIIEEPASMEAWCERWNIKINEDKTQGIYFSRSRRPPVSHLTLNGKDIPFVNSIKYLGLIFDKKVTWRLHIQMIEAKAFRTFIRVYSLLKVSD
jgi:hypothetical protein